MAVMITVGVFDPMFRCLQRNGPSDSSLYVTEMKAVLQSASVRGGLVDFLMTLPTWGSCRNSKSPLISMMSGSS